MIKSSHSFAAPSRFAPLMTWPQPLAESPSRHAGWLTADEERRRTAAVNAIDQVLRPQRIVVIGASRDPQMLGSRIVESLLSGGFRGVLYVVHPDLATIQGVETVPSVQDLPRGIDLAIVCVPADAVLEQVEECAHAGVSAVAVISAGFAETGRAGQLRQEALLDLVRDSGMRLLGPNCLGVVNLDPAVRLHAACSPILPAAGRISLASQSGALGIAVLDLAAERELGLASFVSLGNTADLSSNDLLEYWESDSATRVVLLYLESFGNPLRFARIARRLAARKPIVALKAARTDVGVRSEGARVPSLGSHDAVVRAMFEQTGVIAADRIDEMFDIAACLDLQPLPRGKRVAIVTNASGPGILATDACAVAGLSVASLSEETCASLAEVIPARMARDPRDGMVAVAGPSAYRASIQTVLRDPGVDAVVVIYAPVEGERAADVLASIGAAVAEARADGMSDKPVLVCTVTRKRRAAQIASGGERLPVYVFPENAVRALGKIAVYAEWRRDVEKAIDQRPIVNASASDIHAELKEGSDGKLSRNRAV
jgi:acetate---CoA ligase (ADP-forming)